MELPVKFPSETEVILEDVARFRALSPAERMRTIEGILSDGLFLMKRSPNSVWIEQDAREQERLKRQKIREFIDRHAH